MHIRRPWIPLAGAALLAVFSISPTIGSADTHTALTAGSTATPIKHLVVIFQENVSFDHYFGTYPNAANTDGQRIDIETDARVNNLISAKLLTGNPNLANPQRYAANNVNDLLTCDQNHDYTAEQQAFDGGKMDKFVQSVGTDGGSKSPEGNLCNANEVMNYYDGNTVTAFWNYAAKFAMSDNSFGTVFGPSSPGAINLISGNTGTAAQPPAPGKPATNVVANGHGGLSLTGDDQPYYDDCSTRDSVVMNGSNIGDLLNAAGLSWGWFQGGFKPTTTFASAAPGQPTSTFIPDQFSGKFATKPASNQGICNAVHPVGIAVGGIGQYGFKDDYIPHHEPFMYYASTANPHHLAPVSLAAIGTDTQSFVGGVPQFNTANHQYDSSDFDALVAAINHGLISPDNLPAVSFLKAPGYQDGHAGYSDPIDEQQFIVDEINALEHTPDWSSTAVVIAYDDSDGWYDHAFSGVTNPSNTAADALTGTGACGSATAPRLGNDQGRCGYGPRQPLLVISPLARHGAVDHTLTDQSSILKFAEDNWHLGRIDGSFDGIAGSLDGMFNFHDDGNNSRLFLDPTTGQPIRSDQ